MMRRLSLSDEDCSYICAMLVGSRHRGHHTCCSVVHTETVEDYLKAIFELVTRSGEATTSTLAERLGVAPPTVSAMLKRLAADDLVIRQGAHRVALTEHGTEHALAVVRRHRLIEEFLVKALDVPWEDVHAEAEVLEHAVSDRSARAYRRVPGPSDPRSRMVIRSRPRTVRMWNAGPPRCRRQRSVRRSAWSESGTGIGRRCATSANSGFAPASCWMWSSRLHSAGRCG